MHVLENAFSDNNVFIYNTKHIETNKTIILIAIIWRYHDSYYFLPNDSDDFYFKLLSFDGEVEAYTKPALNIMYCDGCKCSLATTTPIISIHPCPYVLCAGVG